MSNKTFGRAILIGLYTAALLLPLYVYFYQRGGASFLENAGPGLALKLLFPLIGLYAFTLVTLQVLVATNIRWLRRFWPGILRFHRAQGSFALLFAVLHPGFILLGYGAAKYLSFRYVAPDQVWWLLPGYAALIILLLTTGTALLAWRGRDIPWWRKLHRLNYAVFVLAWLHSWFIGSDTQSVLLRTVWVVYLLVVIVSVTGKYSKAIKRLIASKQDTGSVPVKP
jgi:DMSO/TMAO reductase YedYZ heme-binding membrane subunit